MTVLCYAAFTENGGGKYVIVQRLSCQSPIRADQEKIGRVIPAFLKRRNS